MMSMNARWARAAIRGAALLAIAAGVTVATASAHAVFVDVPTDGSKGYLRLTTDADPIEIGPLRPGESAEFVIEANLSGARSGSLSMQLRGAGELVEHAAGLTIEVGACAVAHSREPAVCPIGETTVIPPTRLADIATATSSRSWRLDDLHLDATRSLRVSLGLPRSFATETSDGLVSGSFAVGLYAAGDSGTGPGGGGEPGGSGGGGNAPGGGSGNGDPDADGAGSVGSGGAGTVDGLDGTRPGHDRLAQTGTSALAMLLTAGGAIVLALTLRPRARYDADTRVSGVES